MRWIVLTTALGLTACVAPVSTTGLSARLGRSVAALRGALTAYAPQTPGSVGEAGTDAVLGFEAGCSKAGRLS